MLKSKFKRKKPAIPPTSFSPATSVVMATLVVRSSSSRAFDGTKVVGSFICFETGKVVETFSREVFVAAISVVVVLNLGDFSKVGFGALLVRKCSVVFLGGRVVPFTWGLFEVEMTLLEVEMTLLDFDILLSEVGITLFEVEMSSLGVGVST